MNWTEFDKKVGLIIRIFTICLLILLCLSAIALSIICIPLSFLAIYYSIVMGYIGSKATLAVVLLAIGWAINIGCIAGFWFGIGEK